MYARSLSERILHLVLPMSSLLLMCLGQPVGVWNSRNPAVGLPIPNLSLCAATMLMLQGISTSMLPGMATKWWCLATSQCMVISESAWLAKLPALRMAECFEWIVARLHLAT